MSLSELVLFTVVAAVALIQLSKSRLHLRSFCLIQRSRSMPPFAVASLIAQKIRGGGDYSLLWASGDILSFSDLCVAEKIAGVFFEPLKGKAKLNGTVIAQFRAAKIPVILIGGDAASKQIGRAHV